MKGISLHFFSYEMQKHRGILLHEWLLEKARKLGIRGGTVYRAVAGYGRQRLHEEHFFEIAANVPMTTVFIVTQKEAKQLFSLLKKEKINLFYQQTPTLFGTTGKRPLA